MIKEKYLGLSAVYSFIQQSLPRTLYLPTALLVLGQRVLLQLGMPFTEMSSEWELMLSVANIQRNAQLLPVLLPLFHQGLDLIL